MIDDICEQLYFRTAKKEWASLEELSEVVCAYCQDGREAQELMRFMKKHLLEVDDRRKRARLRSWFYRLFEISIS